MREAARMYSLTGQNEKRVAILEEILDHTVAEYGAGAAETLRPEFSLATTLAEVGRIGDARAHAEHVAEGYRRIEGANGQMTLEVEIYLATLRLTQGATEDSEARSHDLLARCREAFGEDHETTRTARSQYAATLVVQGRFDDAADLYRDRPFPSDLGIARAFQGALEPAAHSAQLLVFWEPWCPFSQRLLPSLERTYQRYRDQDLDVVAICKLDRTATPDAALDFITANRLSYPCVYSDGTINAYFAQPGTPFVVLVRDGRQVWESYSDLPGRVPAFLLDGLVQNAGS
jgi:thiol-disulfide isomerase/thioredoxin